MKITKAEYINYMVDCCFHSASEAAENYDDCNGNLEEIMSEDEMDECIEFNS